MSTDPTATEVFEEVEADPDAILAAFGVDSPADLVDAGGDHDPMPDDDTVDTTATELFADLADVETADATSMGADSDETCQPDEADGSAATHADLEFEFIGDSDVIVRDDGDVIDATAAELGALTATDPTDPVSTESTNPGDPDGDVEPAASPDTSSTNGAASSGTLTIRESNTDDLELVGPEPTPTRITDDTFGSDGIDAH
ncbi:hypothetical protein [Natrinema sp. SYSU A 869]|uniref:hypothetical protein n=1 Tax=Natrinema sp. SYSU A 869 TaxID=2871694 RepID=UPI001CA44E5D|nr:hypothetical protein [Natrinema sp. SYSU A 869]